MTISKLFEKKYPQDGTIPEWAKALAIEFAQFHVEEALKVAHSTVKEEWIPMNNSRKGYFHINKDVILTAYPIENIK